MPGTVKGGKAAAITNKKRYGTDYYSRIGKEGVDEYKRLQKRGKAKPRGFAARPDLASSAGKKGGSAKRGDK